MTDYYWQLPRSVNGASTSQIGYGVIGDDNVTPFVSFDAETGRTTFPLEPIVTAYDACTFAALPAEPRAWQRVVVTDKAIGSGAQGVMAMWNPNTKTWTGLSGEPLT